MKLTPVVNIINILQAAFEPIFFHQKIQIQTVIREKVSKALSYIKGAHKMLMKLTPCQLLEVNITYLSKGRYI